MAGLTSARLCDFVVTMSVGIVEEFVESVTMSARLSSEELLAAGNVVCARQVTTQELASTGRYLQEFNVTIEKNTLDQKIGLIVFDNIQEFGLVQKVQEGGSIDVWNSKHVGIEIRNGDCLVSING